MADPRLRTASATRALVFVVAAALVAVGGGCADERATAPPPESAVTPTAPADAHAPAGVAAPGRAMIAEATMPSIEVFDEAHATTPARALANPTESGAPLVFLIERIDEGWYHVYLPIRPNGGTGWIRSSDARLSSTDYRVTVLLAAHRIRVTKGEEVVLEEPIGVGTQSTPTPGGVFFIKELLRPPRADGVYGPYAYGLSGYSNVLTEFAGGPGAVGIHGTNDPSSIGRDVSHGCIRMSNEGITELAALLPLGTPVDIVP